MSVIWLLQELLSTHVTGAPMLLGVAKSWQISKPIHRSSKEISTTKAAYELAQELGVYMPITQAIYQVIYENVNINDAVWNSWVTSSRQRTRVLINVRKDACEAKARKLLLSLLRTEPVSYQQPKPWLKKCCQSISQLFNLSLKKPLSLELRIFL